MNPMLGSAIVLGALCALMLGVRALLQGGCVGPEVSRKLVHLGMGAICLALPWLFTQAWLVWLLGGLIAAGLGAVRVVPGLNDQFGGVLGGVGRDSWGDLYFPVALATVYALTKGEPRFFCVPVAVMAFADSAGALVGHRWGRIRYEAVGTSKSVEGSAAVLLVSWVCVTGGLAVFTDLPWQSLWLEGLALGLFAMLVEAASWRGLDNLLLPLGVLAYLKVMAPLGPADLAWRAAGLGALALVLLAWRRRSFLHNAVRKGAAAGEPDGGSRPAGRVGDPAPISGELPMGADARVQAGGDGGTALLWWTQVPALAGERLGAIGGFQAATAAGATEVLAQACERLRAQGCTLAVGPMDGNTWRRYRFVTETGSEPPFFLEPTNPPEWPVWWRAAGFGPLAEYYSSVTDDLAVRDPRLAGVAARMAAEGVRIRQVNPAEFEEDLGRIYDVSVVAFRANYLYTPLPREAFLAQYRAVQTKLRPELVLLAEREGQAIGYIFAIPDFAAAQRGEPVTTVVAKTLAVLPARRCAGLGALLLGEVHAAAGRLGFTRVIHALMHESNPSRNLSAHYARTFRRYTLFARRLSA
jgi:dolichol kinase/L-amino acid N-acyltransferase YncA